MFVNKFVKHSWNLKLKHGFNHVNLNNDYTFLLVWICPQIIIFVASQHRRHWMSSHNTYVYTHTKHKPNTPFVMITLWTKIRLPIEAM
jgi:hypothetical protein